jgi:hypothetical protein
MTVEDYIAELETLVEDNGIEFSSRTIERFAKRAKELEIDTNLSEEDIFDELQEIIPKKFVDNEEVYEVILQFADIVVAEFESCDNVEDEEE